MKKTQIDTFFPFYFCLFTLFSLCPLCSLWLKISVAKPLYFKSVLVRVSVRLPGVVPMSRLAGIGTKSDFELRALDFDPSTKY
jgi:hypothetical protein